MNGGASQELVHYGKYVNHLSKLIRYSINSLIEQDGEQITCEQSRLLGYIFYRNDNGECVYQKDIESEFGIKRSSVTSILSNLEKGGYIIREVDKSDSRIKRIMLTDKGISVQKRITDVIRMIETEIVRGMTKEECDTFLRLTKQAIANIEAIASDNV